MKIGWERPPGSESGEHSSYMAIVTNTGRQTATVLEISLGVRSRWLTRDLSNGRLRIPRRIVWFMPYPEMEKQQPIKIEPGDELVLRWPSNLIDDMLAVPKHWNYKDETTRDDLILQVRTGNRWIKSRAGIKVHRYITKVPYSDEAVKRLKESLTDEERDRLFGEN